MGDAKKQLGAVGKIEKEVQGLGFQLNVGHKSGGKNPGGVRTKRWCP